MEEKKTRKADLERRRPLWFVAGFVVSATLLVVTIETVTVSGDDYDYDALSAYDFPYDEPLPPSIYIEEIAAKNSDDTAAEPDIDNIAVTEEPPTKPEEPDIETAIANVEAADISELLPDEPPAESNATLGKPLPVRDTAADATATIPQFPGGAAALKRWIARHLRYPATAQSQGRQGDVVVSFIVREDGTTSDHRIVKSAGQPFDDEALRVLQSMPRWTPATGNGEPRIAMVAVPIVFRM